MSYKTSHMPLISMDDVQGLMGQPNVKLFDVRGGWSSNVEDGLQDYSAGHIPGAIFLDWRSEFIETGKERNLASVASYEEAVASFKALGITAADTVILYDDYHHMQAGRMWWAMSYWGFENVYVLEGGLKNWNAKGGALTTEVSLPPDISDDDVFKPVLQANYKRDLADIETQLGQFHLIDARGPIGYKGDPENPRSGHIPTAIHIPYTDVLDADTGMFKSNEDLKTLFGARLENFEQTSLTSSCGAGYAGTVILLALRKIGISAPLYDGSFSEWKQDPARPVVQGPNPT